MTDGRSRHLPWWPPLLGLAITIALFFPGYMTVDSAVQLWHARTGVYTSDHPALMAMLWSLTDRLLPGPGGLFLLFAAAYWWALAWLLSELRAHRTAQAEWLLGLGLWPASLLMLAHLWKDVPTAVCALLALACLCRDARLPALRWRGLAVMFLVLACCFRHNALPFVLPWAWYLSARLPDRRGRTPARIAASLALTAAIGLLASLPNRLPQVVQRAVWPTLQVTDLAAMSVRGAEMRVPASVRDADLDLDALRAAYLHYAPISLLAPDRIRASVLADLDPAQRADINAAWWSLWRERTGPMLAYRLELTGMLLGLAPSAVPTHMTATPTYVQPPIGPEVGPVWPWHETVAKAVTALAATPLLAAWPYLLLGFGLACSAWRRPVHPVFWPLLWSAALFAAPLPLLVASAEYRYLYWPVLACLIALPLRLAPMPDGCGRAPGWRRVPAPAGSG